MKNFPSFALCAIVSIIILPGCKPSEPPPPPTPTSTQPAASPTANDQTAITPTPITYSTQSNTQPTTPTTPTPPKAAENSSATVAVNNSAGTTDRSAFVSNLRIRLDAINQEINALDAQVVKKNVGDPTKEIAQARIDTLRAEAQSVKVQLNTIGVVTDAGWGEFAARLDKSCLDLRQATADTREWLENLTVNKI